MNERSSTPLAIAILAMLMAILSYAIKDETLARVVYGCGLLSACLSVIHWFKETTPRRR